MEKLLKLAEAKADRAEVMRVRRWSSPVNFYNFRSVDVLARDTDEISLRVIKNGKLGTFSGSFVQDRDMMVDFAVRAADVGPEVSFKFPCEKNGKSAKIFDPELAELSVDKIISDGEEIYDYVRNKLPLMLLNLYFNKESKVVSLMNSSGRNESYEMTLYTVCLLSMFQKSKEGINKEITGCRYFKFPEDTIHELIDEYRFTSREVKAPSKKMPVIFRSSATWSLVYRLLEGVNGENWVRGITPLKERVGEKIFGDNITFIDDPEMDYAIGATPFDDEGFPTRKKVIVENGVLKNFIFDLSSGAKSGKGSTGNGIKRSMWTRGIEEPPNPRFNNLVLLPGDWELEDMIKDMGEGVIVNDVIGFHSGNILQGQYSMNVGIGFYVKGGEIQGRVVDTMISGNVYDDFFRVRGLGKKIEYNPQVYSPDMYFSEIQVSGKG